MSSLVLLAQAATVSVALLFAAGQAERSAEQSLQVASAVADSFLEIRKAQLATSVSILAKDFALRQAVATENLPTAKSALYNHATRIKAHHAMLLNTDGDVMVSIGDPLEKKTATWQKAIASPGNLVVLNDKVGDAYQVELAPINAPELIGWVTIGFRLDDQLAQQLRQITSTGVTFVDPNAPTPEPTDSYTLNKPLNTTGVPISLRISQSKSVALANFFDLRNNALWISAISIGLALVVALLMAKRLTARLTDLAEFAAKVAGGRYDSQPPTTENGFNTDEVTQLASTLHTMQKGIAERERQIRHHATHDRLTGLLAHEGALDALQEILDDAWQDFTAAVIVVRGIQDLNSSLGLEAGDGALRTFADKLQRMSYPLTARLSDTRFLVVMDSSNRRTIADSVERLTTELQLVHIGEDVQIRLDLYVGACLCHPTTDARLCTRQAWSASLKAVQRLEPLVWHEIDDSMQQQRRLTIMRDLKPGIAQGQFHLVYQPKFSTAENRFIGAEALLRWEHPNLGQVPVDEFVAIAEQSQDIRVITRWVLETALEQTALWRQHHPEFQIAVNIAAHDLSDDEFASFIAVLLERHALPGTALQLEITENALIKDWNKTRETLDALDRQQITIAIDDFGTGFSSLSQLRDLPAHVLKIDKSFVINLAGTPANQRIVKSSIDLGHDLNLQIVAEGVENHPALDILTQWGCDYLQGYHLSRPVPPAELIDIIDAQDEDGQEVGT